MYYVYKNFSDEWWNNLEYEAIFEAKSEGSGPEVWLL
jgi:hypothetical protein